MSLWYESLGQCLYDSGRDLEQRAKCIVAHLSMPVPRLWWKRALETGNISDSHIHILRDLCKELLKVPTLAEQLEFDLLVALAFADEELKEGESEYGTLYRESSVEDYLTKAKLILAKHPELSELGETIKKRLQAFT